VIHLDSAFGAPFTGELRHRVHELLCQGMHTIVLDLAGVSTIDAAGVGQLVRAYNVAIAAEGVLTIVHAAGPVREVLRRAGLFDLLSAGAESTPSNNVTQ
jgi:anti-anti-sigma factor